MIKGICKNREKNITIFHSCVSNLALDINANFSVSDNHALDSQNNLSADKVCELVAFKFAETHGLMVRIIGNDWKKLCHRDFPSVVKHIDGHYFLLIRASDIGVLVYDQAKMKTSILSKEQFLALWSGYAIIFQRESHV